MSQPPEQGPQDPYAQAQHPQQAPYPPPFQPQHGQPQYGQPQYGQPQYGEQPPPGWVPPSYPGAPTQDERNWAIAAHVGVFVAAYVAMGFLAPLIVMLSKGPQSAYVRHHAVESLNFQISALIYAAVCFVLIFVVIGIPMLVALGVFYLVVVIMGTVAASAGRPFRYPLTIRFVH